MQDSTGGTDGLMGWGVNGALETFERVLRETKDWEQARIAGAAWPKLARDLGTAVHKAVDHFNRGLPLDVTSETAPYVAQYAAWVRNNNIDILGSEKVVLNTAIGFGGQYDSLCRINGELALVDVKSGSQKDSQRLQLTGLSMAEWHGENNQEAEPMPKVDVAYILLLRADTAPELIRHEITDADREHFKYLVETFHRVRGWAKQFAPTVVTEEKAA